MEQMERKQPVNILLVDDQPAKLLSYESVLGELGENLIRASSGNEALAFLLRTEIAVVLVDVQMPEMDGYELASLIRSHPRFSKTAIILVSGVFTEERDRIKGYLSGAMDYVLVPIVPEILRAKVRVFADLYRKTIELERLNQELEDRVQERTAQIEESAARVQSSEERLRLVLTTSGIQGWTWDLRRNEFTWIGSWGDAKQACQSFADFLTVVRPGDRKSVQDAFNQAVNSGLDYHAEFRTLEGGEDRWWLGRGTVIRDTAGEPTSIAGININITAQKRAEEERAILLRNAEAARREAERANRLKDEFLALLSHELRTPLNAITGWGQMLQGGGLDPETQAKAISTINRNALLQAQLISDLLDVSRIVSGKLSLDPKPLDLRAVVKAVLDSVRPAAEAKEIQIDLSVPFEPCTILGDNVRLQQVVWNLLSNAARFAPQKGHIQISVEKTGPDVGVSVQDDGPGIPQDFLPHMFEPFRQANPVGRQANQGLGLGLAIVRNLVEAHGGHVQAANREDHHGAIFKAVLPLSSSAPELSIAHRNTAQALAQDTNWMQSAPSLRNIRVVVVDDESDSRDVAALVLERCGARVRMAASAAEAFEMLVEELPDVIAADIEMPGEDGYSLLRRIRGLPAERGGSVPVIAYTARVSPQDRSRLLLAGFSRHVPKPLIPLDLVTAVVSLAGQRDATTGAVLRRPDQDELQKGEGSSNGDSQSIPHGALAARRRS
jgi:signal transduction histidine kinase/DNA-binding response OmpR family regulator